MSSPASKSNQTRFNPKIATNGDSPNRNGNSDEWDPLEAAKEIAEAKTQMGIPTTPAQQDQSFVEFEAKQRHKSIKTE